MLQSQQPRGLSWLRSGDTFIAAAVVLVVAMLIIPVPSIFLDLLLAFNLAASLTILFVALYTENTLEFSVFPSLLLITTLLRLSLNVSSTRQILLTGQAPSIITQFGDFVLRGNPVVGIIVFIILVVIQFVVITKGSERVSEVAARFTLDAMPGKQMAIDADLNAGLITPDDARDRRKAISQEADFYGAMDGGAKFVKGDAIAAIIIVVVNLIGGVIIGVTQLGMDALSAFQNFAKLSVGDGLVSQIPALLISTATGLIVTRAAAGGSMGAQVSAQFVRQPRAMMITGGVMLLLAIVPGLPMLPFLVIGAGIGGLGYAVDRKAKAAPPVVALPEAPPAPSNDPQAVLNMLPLDPLELELGYGLLTLADGATGITERLGLIRKQVAEDLGLVIPFVRMRDNLTLPPHAYHIKLRGVVIARGELLPDHYLAMNTTGTSERVPGVPTTEPAFGMPALWIGTEVRDRAELAGYTVVDPPSVLATHLSETLKSYAAELLGRQEVKALVELVKQSHPALVEELVPKVLSLGEVQKVLQNLLREQVPIRDLITIFETLADYAPTNRDTDQLTEYTRTALGRMICARLGLSGRVSVLTVHPDLEARVLGALERKDGVTYLNMEPGAIAGIVQSTQRLVAEAGGRGLQPLLLTAPSIRPVLRKMLESALPRQPVVSYSELDPKLSLEAIGVVVL